MTERTGGETSGRLQFLCVGTGRDGTHSLTYMIQELFDRAGGTQKVAHEYKAREFYQAFCEYKETNDVRFLAEIRRFIQECPYECIVGNGYAAVLPFFVDVYGKKLKLVHLRRHDRDSCIRSCIANAEFFPTAYGNYSTDPRAVSKRMAAFHFGEMTQEDWSRLAVTERFGWYYDKTHALVDEHRHLFVDCLDIATEQLSHAPTREAIASFILNRPDLPIGPVHINSHAYLKNLPPNRRLKIQWLLNRLNLHRVADDEVYAIDYFLEQFIAWTGYQIHRTPQIENSDYRGIDELAKILDRAEDILRIRLQDIERLRNSLQSQNLINGGEAPPT